MINLKEMDKLIMNLEIHIKVNLKKIYKMVKAYMFNKMETIIKGSLKMGWKMVKEHLIGLIMIQIKVSF